MVEQARTYLQHLYEEMEQQIQRERKAIRAEEELKEQRTRKELQAVLEMKDAQLNNLLEKQKVLQQQLEQVRGQVPEIKEENIHLVKEKISLEHQVADMCQTLSFWWKVSYPRLLIIVSTINIDFRALFCQNNAFGGYN